MLERPQVFKTEADKVYMKTIYVKTKRISQEQIKQLEQMGFKVIVILK